MEKLVEVLQQQIASQEKRYEEKLEQQKRYEEQSAAHVKLLQELIQGRPQTAEREAPPATAACLATPTFNAFDSTSELWSDYWCRFCIFVQAHSVPKEKAVKVFLTNQSPTTYKML